MYFHRILEPIVQKYCETFSVVGLTGPRQSGKSTLLQHLLPDYTYITFDDISHVDEFEDDPAGFMARYNDKVIFDEAQTVPHLFNYVKMAVDNDRQNKGKYILSGSAQFTLLQSITESLAGRIGLLSLLPMQYAEIPQTLVNESAYKGCYPELIAANFKHYKSWYASYFSTYINRDVRLLSHVGDLRDFQRFVRLLAANTAQLLNMSYYAKSLGISVPTIKRWLSILEASYIIFLLPPFYNNLGKRIVKNPKVYFYDTALVCYLVGIDTEEQFRRGSMAGSLFENYVITEIVKKETHNKTHVNFSFFRTQDGSEVDLIIDHGQHQEFIEIKQSSTFKPKMLTAIKSLIKDTQNKGTLIYRGTTRDYTPDISLANIQDYLDQAIRP